jgi:26S proteasome regulatory subunit T6
MPQVMGKAKVLVKVHPEGKYVVDLDKDIEISQVGTHSQTTSEGSYIALRQG